MKAAPTPSLSVSIPSPSAEPVQSLAASPARREGVTPVISFWDALEIDLFRRPRVMSPRQGSSRECAKTTEGGLGPEGIEPGFRECEKTPCICLANFLNS